MAIYFSETYWSCATFFFLACYVKTPSIYKKNYITLTNIFKRIGVNNQLYMFAYCSLRLNQMRLIKSVLTGHWSLSPSLLRSRKRLFRSRSQNMSTPLTRLIYQTLLHSSRKPKLTRNKECVLKKIFCFYILIIKISLYFWANWK